MASSNVRIKARHIVKPADSTWKSSSSHVIPLSELDQVIGPNHTQTIYVYKPPAANETEHPLPQNSIVNTLKESLGRALVVYYPLAGRLHRLDGARLELRMRGGSDDNDDDEQVLGAELIEAKSDSRLDDFKDFSSPEMYRDLVPSVKFYESKPIHEIPLLMVQITFLACGGLTLGFSICHSVVDGTGIGYFINDWSRLARDEPIEEYPCHDRTLLRAGEAPRGMYSEAEITELVSNYRKIKHNSEDHHHMKQELAAETKTVILKLTKSQVEKLRSDANGVYLQPTSGNININNSTASRPFSRYEVLASHVWRSTCKARGYKTSDNQQRALGIAIDARSRIRSFPLKYFGNCAFIVGARSPVELLLQNPLGYSCQRIREAINSVTEDYVWSEVEFLKCLKDLSICQELRGLRNRSKEEVYVNPDPGVLSWLNLKIFSLDLGWGKPICVRPGEHNLDGVVLLIPGCEGDGSVDVMVSLQVDHIDGFKKYFFEDI